MIGWTAAALMLTLVGGAAAGAVAVGPIEFAQVTVRERIILRVPAQMRPAPPSTSRPMEWKESRGPKCIPSTAIAGATLLGQNSVDLVLRDNSRVRVKLENRCPALDFYRGFYIRPNADGRICADRDAIRSRMGGQCEIDAFRALKPRARD